MKLSTILLIEDNPDDEELTIRALKRNKIDGEIVVIRDGAEAVKYIESLAATRGETPGLVLLDLKLPKVEGLEVLRFIRKNEYTALMPVVILTSSNEDKDIQESYASHVNSYIRKPVDFVQFTETIKNVAQYWLYLNESPRS